MQMQMQCCAVSSTILSRWSWHHHQGLNHVLKPRSARSYGDSHNNPKNNPKNKHVCFSAKGSKGSKGSPNSGPGPNEGQQEDWRRDRRDALPVFIERPTCPVFRMDAELLPVAYAMRLGPSLRRYMLASSKFEKRKKSESNNTSGSADSAFLARMLEEERRERSLGSDDIELVEDLLAISVALPPSEHRELFASYGLDHDKVTEFYMTVCSLNDILARFPPTAHELREKALASVGRRAIMLACHVLEAARNALLLVATRVYVVSMIFGTFLLSSSHQRE